MENVRSEMGSVRAVLFVVTVTIGVILAIPAEAQFICAGSADGATLLGAQGATATGASAANGAGGSNTSSGFFAHASGDGSFNVNEKR